MNRVRRMGGGVGLIVAIAMTFVAVVAFFAVASKAEAVVIAGPHVCTYYSSKTFKTVVGARGTGCCGEVISWGVTSPYVRCERLNCLDVLCPN